MKKETWLSVAELFDAFRIVPRILLVGYGILLYKTVTWYMMIAPLIIDNKVLIDGPTTQHAALITAVVGLGAAIFGLYSNSGRSYPQKPNDK